VTRPVGRCVNCFHDFSTGPCGGCGAIPGPHDTDTVPVTRVTTEPAPDTWAENRGPFTLMALACDHPDCGTPALTADIRADTRVQALAGIRDHGRRLGWTVTDDAAWSCCPQHGHPTTPAEQPASMLGVPGTGDQ